MTDGVLDLLSAILVLGIVVSICFGFILPLTNSDYMGFDSQYQDKGVVDNTIDYAIPAEDARTLTTRMYTYEEMLLLLRVQDSRMEEPKYINLRNLVTSADLSYSGYSSDFPGNGKANSKKNINSLPFDLTDEVHQGLIRYAENALRAHDESERSEIAGSVASITKPNVGNIQITDTYALKSYTLIQELNGAEKVNIQDGMNEAGRRYTDLYRLSGASGAVKPDANGDGVFENRIYYVTHHFAIPDDSNYIKGTQFTRPDDEKAAYFVEVKGRFPRNNGYSHQTPGMDKGYVDTYAEYQNFLTLLRDIVKGNK